MILKEAIEQAIRGGIPASYFSYLLLLPIIASLIASARHLLGLTTYGTFLPAVISIIWLETGLGVGFLISAVLFFWMRTVRFVTKKTLRKFKINYLPRMAIFLLFLSLGLLAIGLRSDLAWIFKKETGIFAFLVLVLIIQNLVETQISLSKKEARAMIMETVAFAVLGYFLLGCSALQNWVLAHPELAIVLMLAFNIYVGRYVGFRLFEYRRFKSIIRK